MKDERWSRPKGVELDENVDALRRMRAMSFVLVALLLGSLCLWAGLFVGSMVYGG